MGFKFFQIFAQSPKVVALGFIKNASLRQKLTETLYFFVVTPIFRIGYT